MTLVAGPVVLSDRDTDAQLLPAVATVSKNLDKAGWEHGGYELGSRAAAVGGLWVDRPYFTGDPDPAWVAAHARRVAAAGGVTQDGNEEDLPLEGWVGGPAAYVEHHRRVRELAPGCRVLHAPVSGEGDLAAWVDVTAEAFAAHCYGPLEHMQARVQWYLDHTAGDLYVTECNPGAGNRFELDAWAEQHLRPFLDWCAGHDRVKALFYFAWRWDQSPHLPSSVDAAGTAVARVLHEWTPPIVSRETPPSPPPEESPQERPVSQRWIDISNYQGTVDMSRWRDEGVAGVIVRISEDGCAVDPFARANWEQAARCGLRRAGYHLSHPDAASPGESLETLKRAVVAIGGLRRRDGLVLDAELGGGNQAQWMAEFGRAAADTFDFKLGFYSAPWFMGPRGLEIQGVAQEFGFLWDAGYTGNPDARPSVDEWGEALMVQWTANGSIDGVAGDVDLDTFFGSDADWDALAFQGEAWPAEAAPTSRPAWAPRAVPSAVTEALDTLWAYVGPDVEAQDAIARVKVAIGLQEAA